MSFIAELTTKIKKPVELCFNHGYFLKPFLRQNFHRKDCLVEKYFTSKTVAIIIS